jgi:cytochrome c553
MQPLAAQLGPEELESVVRWYASQPLPSDDTGQRPQEPMAQRLQDERLPLCHACHGSGGAPSHPSFPRLAGQSPEYLEQQLRLFAERRRGGGRYAALMHTVVDWLQPEEFPRVARTLAKLPSMPSPSP